MKIKRKDISKKEVRKALIDIKSIPGIKMISGLVSKEGSILNYRIEFKEE